MVEVKNSDHTAAGENPDHTCTAGGHENGTKPWKTWQCIIKQNMQRVTWQMHSWTFGSEKGKFIYTQVFIGALLVFGNNQNPEIAKVSFSG
jgi:hypothetical protein